MDNLYEQIVNISKAGAFDVISKQRDELVIENKKLKEGINKALDEKINTNASLAVDNPGLVLQNISRHLLDALRK